MLCILTLRENNEAELEIILAKNLYLLEWDSWSYTFMVNEAVKEKSDKKYLVAWGEMSQYFTTR